MTVPQITPLPTPPQRNDPANFAARGDAFMAAMPTFVTQTNAAAESINAALTTVAPVVNNLPVILASPANATIAQQNAASSNTYRQQAAASATAAQTAQTAAQNAAATAQAIVWQGTTGYPKIRPSLLLDFANSETVDPRITFIRASIGYRTDEKGVLRKAEVNEPRIDHDPVTGECKGLLIKESRTNLLTYSEQFDNAVWDKARATVTANTVVAPDGTLTGCKLVEDTTASATHITRQIITVTSGVSYTVSVYAKKAERSSMFFNLQDTVFPAGTDALFDLNSGTATGTGASIKSVGNGWYRCSLTATATATNIGLLRMYIYEAGLVYTGDGTSGIYIWGAQLEEGSFPTSYIPTPATFTSRASEGTYTDSTGLLKTAAIDEARYDHGLVDGVWVPKGLLLEPQRTNLLTYSEQLDNAAWAKTGTATVTANSAAGPDGATTADLITGATDFSSNTVSRASGVTIVSGNRYTFSVFVKLVTATTCSINLRTVGGAQSIISTFASSVDVGNGWRKVSASMIADTAAAQVYFGNADGTFLVIGAQLEEIPAGQSPEPSSPIKTEATAVTRSADISTSSAVTRAADAATLPIGDWHNRYAGTWLIKASVRSGEPVITAGDITITADTDAEKTYALAYDTVKNAANVQLGKGTFKQVAYYPKKLLTNEIAALQA